jgi:hypothetical protein
MTGSQSNQAYAPEALAKLLVRPTPDDVAQLENHVAQLEWGAEKVRLGRALADLDYRHCRRASAEKRLTALMEQADAAHDSKAKLEIGCDLAALFECWDELELMSKALDAIKAESDSSWRAARLKAALYSKQGEAIMARASAEHARTLAVEQGDAQGQAAACLALARLLNGVEGNNPAALEQAELALSQHLAPAGSDTEAELWFAAGFALRRIPKESNEDAAAAAYRRGIEIRRSRGDLFGVADALCNLSYIPYSAWLNLNAKQKPGSSALVGQSHLDAMERLAKESLAVLREAGAPELSGRAYKLLCLVEKGRHRWEQAIAYGKQALEAFSQTTREGIYGQAETFFELGQIYGDAERPPNDVKSQSLSDEQLVAAATRRIRWLEQAVEALEQSHTFYQQKLHEKKAQRADFEVVRRLEHAKVELQVSREVVKQGGRARQTPAEKEQRGKVAKAVSDTAAQLEKLLKGMSEPQTPAPSAPKKWRCPNCEGALPTLVSERCPTCSTALRGPAAQLLWVHQGRAATQILSGALSVGRSALHSQLVLDDPTVSRLHAWIEPRGAGWVARCSGVGQHALWINGQPVNEMELHHGDILLMGKSALLFLGAAPG